MVDRNCDLCAITKFMVHRMLQRIVDIKCIHLMKISLDNLDENVLTSIPKSQRETRQARTHHVKVVLNMTGELFFCFFYERKKNS